MKKIKIYGLFLCLFSTSLLAEVKWDIEIKDMGKYTDIEFLFDLEKGKTATIDIDDAIFCTLENNTLALASTTFLNGEHASFEVKKIGKQLIEIKTENEQEILKNLIEYDGFARCNHWTPNQGKYTFNIDNINGKNKASTLSKKNTLEKLEKLLEQLKK